MAERAVFLDRDNTIIENDGYLGDPGKVKLLQGAATALAAIRALGYRLIVVSNQSGVARGIFDEAAVEAVNDEMSRQLHEQAGAYVDASYYCPYHPEAPVVEYRIDHEWRKPKAGMLRKAAEDFGLDLAQCWMIGDMGRDIAAGAAASCRTILLRDVDRNPASAMADGAEQVSPNFVVRTLADAARIIAREGKNPPTTAPPAPEPTKVVQVKKAVADHRANPLSKTAVPRVPVAEPMPSAGPVEKTAVSVEKADPPAVSTPRPTASLPLFSSLEKNLDDLVIQLRQQQRNAELRPDFSMAKMTALILQALAVVALVLGAAKYFTAPATFTKSEDYFFSQMSHQSALFWVMVAAVIQGMVISLLLHDRQK